MKITSYSIKGVKVVPLDFNEKSLGKFNELLLAQAIRIYVSNSHQKTSVVKTRGEVVGSGKKIYRQKGTGRARHGARYAPIFVGGGIAHGPKGERPQNLVLPKKMRAKALASALLLKLSESQVSGLQSASKSDGKTSSLARLLATVANHPKNKVLVITASRINSLYRGLTNLQGTKMKRASMVNAYDLISSDQIVITKQALDALLNRASGKKPVVIKPTEIAVKTTKTANKPAKKVEKTAKTVKKPTQIAKKPAKTTKKPLKKVTKK
ncbi:MAG: 50S ribosomal protein L4 [bacterium]